MRAKALTIAFIIAFVLGMTATIWNPITRAYDDMTTSWDRATHSSMTEDDPGWDCTTMGNRICGEGVDDSAHPMTAEDCDAMHLDSALCDAIAEGEE